MDTQVAGPFVLKNEAEGKKKRAFFTQFEAADARHVIPRWDEPVYKATFNLTGVIPADQLAISNMPVKTRRELGGGKAEVTFATTPRMSSYLLFFGLGDLERAAMMAGKTEVGVVTGTGNVKQAQYALAATDKVLP